MTGIKPAIAAGLTVAGLDAIVPTWIAPLVVGVVVALIAFLFRREFIRLDLDTAAAKASLDTIRTTQNSHGERLARLEGAKGKR